MSYHLLPRGESNPGPPLQMSRPLFARHHASTPTARQRSSFNHGEGPRVVARAKGKRLEAMAWANEKESELIVARGGSWRDGSHGAAQTLNAKRGGQGDPWNVLCGIASRKSNMAPATCEHQRRRSHCKECDGSAICNHQRRRSQCKECGGSAICEHQRQQRQSP